MESCNGERIPPLSILLAITDLTSLLNFHLGDIETIAIADKFERCGSNFCLTKVDLLILLEIVYRWIRIECVPGDLLVLPAGIYHRFTLDTSVRNSILSYFDYKISRGGGRDLIPKKFFAP